MEVVVNTLVKQDATETADGYINRSIKLTCGETEKTVPIGVTLPKTGTEEKTDAEKVAEAKTAVENALAEITVTEDDSKDLTTLKDTIQDKMDELTVAEDVSVTVGDLNKDETGDAAKVVGTITIECGGTTETVEINKTIEANEEQQTPDQKLETAKNLATQVLTDLLIKAPGVTNDTTEEEIKTAVTNAIEDAGISDATVTIKNFEKSGASDFTEGLIHGSIEIEISGVADDANETVAIYLPIPAKENEVIKAVKDALEDVTIATADAENTTAIKAQITSVLEDENADFKGATVTVSEDENAIMIGGAGDEVTVKLSITIPASAGSEEKTGEIEVKIPVENSDDTP